MAGILHATDFSAGAAAAFEHALALALDLQEDLRSEEHTSELQSPDHPVCRLLLEKKKQSSTATLQC